VQAAPPIPGWSFRALKPKTGLPRTVRWERYTLEVGCVVFEPLESSGSSDLGLRILIEGLDPADRDHAHNAVLRAIDHALGEEAFAEAIGHTEVAPLPDGADRGAFIPLTQLDDFIAWRKGKQESG
jgi:hypothetical protein